MFSKVNNGQTSESRFKSYTLTYHLNTCDCNMLVRTNRQFHDKKRRLVGTMKQPITSFLLHHNYFQKRLYHCIVFN